MMACLLLPPGQTFLYVLIAAVLLKLRCALGCDARQTEIKKSPCCVWPDISNSCWNTCSGAGSWSLRSWAMQRLS